MTTEELNQSLITKHCTIIFLYPDHDAWTDRLGFWINKITQKSDIFNHCKYIITSMSSLFSKSGAIMMFFNKNPSDSTSNVWPVRVAIRSQWRVIMALLAIISNRGQHSLKSSIFFFKSKKACHSLRALGSLRHLGYTEEDDFNCVVWILVVLSLHQTCTYSCTHNIIEVHSYVIWKQCFFFFHVPLILVLLITLACMEPHVHKRSQNMLGTHTEQALLSCDISTKMWVMWSIARLQSGTWK